MLASDQCALLVESRLANDPQFLADRDAFFRYFLCELAHNLIIAEFIYLICMIVNC